MRKIDGLNIALFVFTIAIIGALFAASTRPYGIEPIRVILTVSALVLAWLLEFLSHKIIGWKQWLLMVVPEALFIAAAVIVASDKIWYGLYF